MRARKNLVRTGLCAVVAMALLAVATPADASGAPGAPYTGLGDCPLRSATLHDPTNLQVGCVVSLTNSGSVTIAGTKVPLTSPITLQFGVYWPASGPVVNFPDGAQANVYNTVAPADGRELVANALQVNIPGIANIIPGVTSVFARVQLAGPITQFVPLAAGESFPVFNLPIKIQLVNALLGLTCYLGSNSHPIVLHPMTGTTSPPAPTPPLTGDPGTIDAVPDPNGHNTIVASFTAATLVDNTFAVPGATGCGLLGALDPLVNSAFGLPSAAGRNSVIFSQNNTSLALSATIDDLAAAIADA